MTVLGGSLLQVLIPIIAAVSFVRQEQPFGAAICAWWAGQNFIDLAPYIADARALAMVLLGGRTGAEVEGHDWEYILTQLGVTHLDRQIGMTAYGLGTADHGRRAGLRHPDDPPQRGGWSRIRFL